MQNMNVLKVPLEAEQDFSKFLKRVRKEENIHLEQLAEGLMTASQLARIEKGQRPISKNMRDRLMGRLGVASDMYENLLNIEDYAAWQYQQKILCAIKQKNAQSAGQLISEYERKESVDDRITRQFCLVMKAEVLRQQNAEPCEIAACYERAARCTILDVEHLVLHNKLLSIQELNIILEYEYNQKSADFADKCRDMMAFVENALYDDLSRVKIYPKIAYYFLREILSVQGDDMEWSLGEGLRICGRAIEMLRSTGRAYYLLELLEIRIRLLESIRKEQPDSGELLQNCQESTELAQLLKDLSTEYDVPAYMQDCTYLYHQRWVFYIGDVLRIRRNMYGLTQKELCAGICSVRTLRRTEKGEANMQHSYLEPLLRRLGLSKEFQRARLVTNDREVLKMKKALFAARNNRDFGRCRELLCQIRERISLRIPENQQYIMELEASLDWRAGNISKEEFAAREEKALQCTLNIKKWVNDVEIIYLTEMELSCICKKIQGLAGDEKRKLIAYLIHFFEAYKKNCALSHCIAMFEFVMSYVANELGNMGEHEMSNIIYKKVLKESLICKRVCIIDNILYNLIWNEGEQLIKCGQHIESAKMTKYMKRCILLSHFCRQVYNEKFYKNKLGAVEQ